MPSKIPQNKTAPTTTLEGLYVWVEARPGVEPGYTDLQSVA